MSIKTSKILIPIDFSNQSMYALNQACSLAQTKNSKVYILSVIEEQNKISSLFLDDQTDILQNKVKSKLNQICEEIQSKYKIDIEVMVSKGKVYNQIIDVSKMISTDLIVMGTTGSPKEGFKRFIGSNAERVVRLAQCPVITIKGQNLRNGCQNIILPLDLEKETREKITYAIEYARYWDATIRLVSVLLDDNQQNKNVLIKNINQAERFIKDAGVSCSAELVSGDKKVTLGDFVFNYAKENDGDLIMIMTKKEELSLSQNISVTARYIINNSEIPVMSIRPKKQNYANKSSVSF
ncbi:MAG: hypothetical protein CMD36_07150 [Flavobacteriales bacterium]|nr:hypothetical protein [Flavobacteriales bacterium]|tara:strand:- start:1004 stop:1888 length:885 start_codon:yes stop_codon:yes gene_type:complete